MSIFDIKGRPPTFGDPEQIAWIKEMQAFADCKKMTYKVIAYGKTIKFHCTCGHENFCDIPEPFMIKHFECSDYICDNEYAIINSKYGLNVFCLVDFNEE